MTIKSALIYVAIIAIGVTVGGILAKYTAAKLTIPTAPTA